MTPRPQPHHKPTHHKGEPRALTHPEIRTVVVGIMLAMFLGALDQTIVATALPTIGRTFGNLGDLAWVVTAYLLTATAVTPLYGKLSDIYGRRVTMLSAIVLFVAGSVACAMATSMAMLVLARALQGLGGGGLMALAQTIIADAVSPRERGRYQGYIGAVFATSSVGGPVLGGFLTEHLHWSLIFWINVPLGLAAFAVTSNALKLVPFHPRKHRLDVIGAVLMMLAAVALLLALSWGGRAVPWISAPIGGLLMASAVLWALFALRLAKAQEPFLPLNVLANPVVRAAALAGACNMGTLVGLTIFGPLYFEAVQHLSASESGLALIPMMGATVVFSTITGRLMTHVERYKRMPLAGLTLAILALAALAIWPAMPIGIVLLLMTVIGSGLGTVFPISTVCLQNAVPRAQMGIATGAANFFRALFSALVVAALGAIVLGGLGGQAGSAAVETLARTASAEALSVAFRFVFLACAGVLTFGMAFLIALEERPLKGPPAPGAEAPTAPATPIPNA